MLKTTQHSDSKEQSHGTSAGIAYEMLRDGLMWGRWKSGEKLKPQHLKELFSTTSGALREALIRLAGEGFVQFEEQRGFSTMNPTKSSFLELRALRVLLEKEGLKHSLQNGGMDWEGDIAAAHQRLHHIEKKMLQTDDLSGFIRMWSRYDAQFHAALISGCESDLLKVEHRRIYDLFRVHAVAELGSFGFRGETTMLEHNSIVEAALDRDLDACIEAMEFHTTIYRTQDSLA